MKATISFGKTQRFSWAHRFLGIVSLALFGSVIGWHSLSPYSTQAALQPTVGCQLPTLQKVGAITAASASDVVAADFNRDGKQDVLVVRTAPAQSQTFFGDGAGGFTLASNANGFSVLRNDEILVGEFNGDGFPDLYVRRDDGGNNRQVQIYVNDGQGRFSLGAEINTRVLSLLIGDLNKDGLDDVLANTSGNYAVYLANPNRTFTRLPNEFGFGPSALLLDLNGDGRLDFVNVIRGAANNGTMFIWQGNGNGTFQQMDFLSLPDYVILRKVADLNRDGRPDIAAITACGAVGPTTTKLYLLLNNGRGNFTASTFDLVGAPCDVTIKGVQDFTGDGFPDIALSNRRIALNDGQGNICAVSEPCCSSDLLPTINAVADFNGDNRADVLNLESFTSIALWSAKSATTNTPPTITAAPPLTLRQGYQDRFVTTRYRLATVNDAETAVTNLQITLGGIPTGVSIFDVRTDDGFVTAQFEVGCNVPVGDSPLNVTVTDSGGLSASTTWTLRISEKQAPHFTSVPTTLTVAAGGSLEFATPAAVDASNVPIALTPAIVTWSSFQGSIEAVGNTGFWRIVNAGPVGTHTLTFTVMDRCGLQEIRTASLTVTASSGGGCNAPVFNAAINLDANKNPYGLTSGDFNGDGKPDLATTNFYDHTVTVLLASGNSFTKQPAISVGILPTYLVARDLNGDSKLDLTVVNRGSDTVTILLGNGDGTFTRKGDYPVGNKSTGVALGDFNSDGKLDLILPNDGLGNAAVLDGNGDGSFAPLRYVFAGTSPQPPVVADFNRDGRADVAFPNYLSGAVAILLGQGNGTFQSPIFIGNLGGSGVEAIASGDLNGDGNPDVAVTNTTTNQVHLILGNGQGGFTNGGGFATFSNYPASIVIADVTGDAKADIAVGGYNNGQVHIFKGQGNGFDNNSPLVMTVGQYPLWLLTNDFNGDGKPDFAVANNGSGTVSVLLNGCTR